MSRRRRTVCILVAIGCALLGPACVRAEPPLLRNVVRYSTPASRTLEVYHSLQHVRGDSLDLVRHAPAYARVSHLEAHVVTETHAVYARQADPERYRVRLLRGAPTDWTLEAKLGTDVDAPFAVGPDYVCVWLGAVLVLPERLSPARGSPAVTLAFNAPPQWPTFLPWPSERGAARVDLETVADDFVAAGAWRVSGHSLGSTAAACSLVTCIAGDWPVSDEAWEKLSMAIMSPAPARARALVCIAPWPTDGSATPSEAPRPRLWRGVASVLVLCPTDPASVNRALSLDVEERRLVSP